MMTDNVFPPTFIWGAATASFQIEGATHEDGRSPSIWDMFCSTSGKVRNGENGDIADDHYHRYREDVALMHDLGLNGYRFSVAWPRVIPDGTGHVNSKGLDFYDRLVDELLAAGIQPFVTLYHWDLPQALEAWGGWLNRETVDAFAEYTRAVVARLGDRVHHWITLNEPWVSSWLGYNIGVHAPGKQEGLSGFVRSAHVLLLAHGRAVEVIRGESPKSEVGITLNLTPVYPADPSNRADVEAARRSDGFGNRWFLDPLFKGHYPQDILNALADAQPEVQDGDLTTISAPLDFLGINNYSRQVVRAGSDGSPVHVRPEGSQYTDMDWEVYPQGLYDLLRRVSQDYAPPRIYITENGAAFPDVRSHDGRVHDPERTAYIEGHIEAVGRALQAGVPMAGYFVWSLLDNFEWGFGYWRRFGIIFVDFPTLERIPKDSYRWYRDFIAQQRAEPAGTASAVAASTR